MKYLLIWYIILIAINDFISKVLPDNSPAPYILLSVSPAWGITCQPGLHEIAHRFLKGTKVATRIMPLWSTVINQMIILPIKGFIAEPTLMYSLVFLILPCHHYTTTYLHPKFILFFYIILFYFSVKFSYVLFGFTVVSPNDPLR